MTIPQAIVTVNNWGLRGWRVSLYKPSENPMELGHRVFEEFKRTEFSARKLAKQLAIDNKAKLLE